MLPERLPFTVSSVVISVITLTTGRPPSVRVAIVVIEISVLCIEEIQINIVAVPICSKIQILMFQ